MSYLALARKWRPRTFSQLVGQEHINKALIKSLNQQRLHHAYLFTGTRGVGKTSIARLLAKALNCEQGISAEPCLQCDTCLSVEQGRFIDLIEIDGASRTRVEDTRELLDNVQYSPVQGRFKIYLIDEVHMLSQHSFNALLKTLEEPPSHVKFLLATTDPQKLPITILSRCLQFSLKHLSLELISQHLQFILKEEQLNFDLEATQLLAKAAKGSMRDALSLLDQAIACTDDHLNAKDVKTILGYTQQDYAIQLLHALVNLDAQEIIRIDGNIASEGGHFGYVLDDLLDNLHQITIQQTLNSNNPLIKTNSEIQQIAKQLSVEDVQLFYQIGLKGTQEMYLAPTLAIGFEMILLRMLTFKPAVSVGCPPLAVEFVEKKCPEVVIATEIMEESLETIAQPSYVQPTKLSSPDSDSENWRTILANLKLTGLTLSAAENSEFIQKSEGEVQLRVAKNHQSLFTIAVIQRIEQALSLYYQEAIKIRLITEKSILSSPAQQKQIEQNQRQHNAEQSLQKDPFFQQLKQEFSAELVKNSIVAVKDEL